MHTKELALEKSPAFKRTGNGLAGLPDLRP